MMLRVPSRLCLAHSFAVTHQAKVGPELESRLRRKSDVQRPGRESRAHAELLTNPPLRRFLLSPWTFSRHSALNVSRRIFLFRRYVVASVGRPGNIVALF